jgi:hypothetical protein
MPKRYRGHRLALVALGIIVLGAVLATAFGALEEAQRQACEQPARQCEPNGNDDPYNGWRDTNAQWAMAVFAALGIGVGAWTIILLQRTIKATKRGNKDARLSAERQLRAYVQVELGRVQWRDDGGYRVHITYKNTGQTPSYHVTPMAIVVSFDGWPLDAESEADLLNRQKALNEPTQELSCAPNITLAYTKDVTPALPEEVARIEAIKEGTETVAIVGVVRYLDFTNAERRTWFFHTHRKRNNGTWQPAYHPKGNNAN